MMLMFRPPSQRPISRWFRGALGLLIFAGVQLPSFAATPQVTGGRGFSLALDEHGVLRSWGSNYFGELGDGGASQQERPQVIGTGYREVRSKSSAVFALKDDGSLWAWGSNLYGQLGTGSTEFSSSTPTQVGTSFKDVVPGFGCNFGIKSDKSLWGWGTNTNGELGDGGGTDRYTPVQIGTDFLSVTTGVGENSPSSPIICYTLGLKSNGDLWAWGNNLRGQLGDGTTITRKTPTLVGSGFRWVTVGVDTAYGIKQDHTLWSWGANTFGQLGDGSDVPRQLPGHIATDVQAVYSVGATMFAIKSDGSLWAWGNNSHGQVGDGTQEMRRTPVRIGHGFTHIAPLSDWSVYALKADGSLWAWGDNSRGSFGDGTTTNRLIPTLIGTGFHMVKALTGWEGAYTLAMKTDGSLWAWGDNTTGNLGDGSTDWRMTRVMVLANGFAAAPVDPQPPPATVATFDGTTGVLHLPRVELGDAALQVNLQLVNVEQLTFRVTSFDTSTVEHDSNAAELEGGFSLHIPRLRLADQHFWLILRLIDPDTLTFQITEFGALEVNTVTSSTVQRRIQSLTTQ